MNSFVDFNAIGNIVRGLAVPKPLSGTLSGHAAGEPFDKAVYNELKKVYGDRIFRQYEYLNFNSMSRTATRHFQKAEKNGRGIIFGISSQRPKEECHI